MRHQGLVLRMFDVRCLTADSNINDMEEALRVRD